MEKLSTLIRRGIPLTEPGRGEDLCYVGFGDNQVIQACAIGAALVGAGCTVEERQAGVRESTDEALEAFYTRWLGRPIVNEYALPRDVTDRTLWGYIVDLNDCEGLSRDAIANRLEAYGL